MAKGDLEEPLQSLEILAKRWKKNEKELQTARSSSPGASVDFERSRSPERRAQGSGPRAADEVTLQAWNSLRYP